jgi:hypothetical protein
VNNQPPRIFPADSTRTPSRTERQPNEKQQEAFMRTRPNGRRLFAGGLAVATIAAVALTGASPAAAARANSTVYVVHGIPGTPVDVWVNNTRTLTNFQPKDVAGPLELPEGAYDIALTAPGASDTSGAVLTVNDAAVPGGANISLIANLRTDGSPTITAFPNDVSPVAAGQSRLIVRHTANAPAVDVRAGGTPVFTNLANPNEAKADIPAGSVNADVVAAGTDTVVLGPTTLDLAEGTATIVYAIGALDNQSLDVAAQVLPGLHSAPGGVPTGSGGLADEPGKPMWVYGAALLVLAGVVAAGYKIRKAPADR